MFAEQIDHTINAILMRAENQHELLLGKCQSGLALNNTQEHILMLLQEKPQTNSDLARELAVSQAAVTKSCKQLLKLELIETIRDQKDARVTYFQLSQAGQPIAQEHADHHNITQSRYQALAEAFDSQEQAVIVAFLKDLERTLKDA